METSTYGFTVGAIARNVVSDGTFAYPEPGHSFFVSAARSW